MQEFEKYPKLAKYIQEMANTGKTPREWTDFLYQLNQALHQPLVIKSVCNGKDIRCDAPLSKIVEAIIKSMFGTELPETSRVQWHRDRITEALASLESSEREVLTFDVTVGSFWDYDRSLCHSQYTTKLEVSEITDGAFGKMIRFKQQMAYSAYGIEYFDGKTFKPHIDRYLSEKHKTEKK